MRAFRGVKHPVCQAKEIPPERVGDHLPFRNGVVWPVPEMLPASPARHLTGPCQAPCANWQVTKYVVRPLRIQIELRFLWLWLAISKVVFSISNIFSLSCWGSHIRTLLDE